MHLFQLDLGVLLHNDSMTEYDITITGRALELHMTCPGCETAGSTIFARVMIFHKDRASVFEQTQVPREGLGDSVRAGRSVEMS